MPAIGRLSLSSYTATMRPHALLTALVLVVVPLFLAGLCMVPFLLPLFDRMAKRDLETLRASRGEPGGPTDAADQDRAP